MAKQNTAGNITKKTVRIPLVGNLQQRNTSEVKDQQFLNFMVETTFNPVTETKKLFLVKRPAFTVYPGSFTESGVEGRGCWSFRNIVVSIHNEKVYLNGNDSYFRLSTSVGPIGATEFNNIEDNNRPALFIADGIDAWILTYDLTFSRVDNKYLNRQQNTKYEVGDRVVNIGYLQGYECVIAGRTADVSDPSALWPVGLNNTVYDGTVLWKCFNTSYTGPTAWTASASVSLDAIKKPTIDNGYWYKCSTAGTTSGTEPADWPLGIGLTVTDGTVVWECAGEYGGFPTPHIPTPIYMDNYIVLADANSNDIYNCNITKPTSWGALSFVSVENFPDNIVGLARQNNYIVVFGTNSTEFLYNSAKANGLTDFDSPFSPHETLLLQVGAISRSAILQSEKTIIFIGTSNLGGRSIWRIDGTTAKEISSEYVEKFIDLEDGSTPIYGQGFRIVGHLLYTINLPTSNKTFVYDVEENFWTEWSYFGERLPFVDFAESPLNFLVFQHSNGGLYTMNPNTYMDQFTLDFSTVSATIDARIILSKQDMETDNYKFYHQFTLIGDKIDDPIYLSWSDDDYQTWSTEKALPAGTRPYFMRSGHSRRRAWKLRYPWDSKLRLEAIELTYTIGDH